MKVSEMGHTELASELHMMASKEELKAEESGDFSSEAGHVQTALILRKAARLLLGSLD